jgi:hypothetical protein
MLEYCSWEIPYLLLINACLSFVVVEDAGGSSTIHHTFNFSWHLAYYPNCSELWSYQDLNDKTAMPRVDHVIHPV